MLRRPACLTQAEIARAIRAATQTGAQAVLVIQRSQAIAKTRLRGRPTDV